MVSGNNLSSLSPVSPGENSRTFLQSKSKDSPNGPVGASATPKITRRPAETKTTTVMAIVTYTTPFSSVSADRSQRRSTALELATSSAATVAHSTATSVPAAASGPGLSSGTLTIAIAVPIVLIAVLAPLIILTILTCRRKRRERKRRSHLSVSKKLKLLDRPQDKLEYRPKGKYGPATWQRPLNSFSGFDFNFSRPRTVLSAISARSPRAVTPRPSTPAVRFPSTPDVPAPAVTLGTAPSNRPAGQRRPALSVLSRFAHADGISDPPPPYVTRHMTLAHPYFRPSIPNQHFSDTPQSGRSMSPQLLEATPVEIQSLSGPYAPISQVLSTPGEQGRSLSQAPPQKPRSPFADPPEETPHTSANLQRPFSAPSPAPTNISGLSFDPSAWVASYERNSRISSVDEDDVSRMDPHQIV